MYVCVQGRAHMDIRGQPVGVSSTMVGFGDRTQVLSVGSKDLNLLASGWLALPFR